jgi:fimbrial chaperone protein
LVLLAVVAGPVPAATAATFVLNKTQIFFEGKSRSAVLTLRNTSAEALRFQLNAFAWDENPRGEMVLTRTTDVVFFPPLLTIAAGESRNIRVGTVTPPAAIEKTYRLFIQELPPVAAANPVRPAGEIRVLTRMGVPIFLQPARGGKVNGRVGGVALRRGRLSFRVENTGTVHFVARAVRVTGYGTSGEVMIEGALEGWYVLAGGTREYELDVPPGDCPKVQTLTIEVQTSHKTLTERLQPPPDGCTR